MLHCHITCYVIAGRCDVTLLCNMLYNALLLLPARLAGNCAAVARRGGCQFAGIRLLHPPLHLLLCSTRQPFSLLHALGGPKQAGQTPDCCVRLRARVWLRRCYRHDSRFAFASDAALSYGSCGPGGALQQALIRNLVGRLLHKQGKLASISEL